jgi:lysine 2,3-aminomutase
MGEWQRHVRESIRDTDTLASHFPVESEEVRKVVAEYPVQITPHVRDLIERPDDPIGRQYIPSGVELLDPEGVPDPLEEEGHSEVKCVVHRYPDRALFLVTNLCAVYCRFCTRKRFVGGPNDVAREELQQGIDYIARHEGIRDVILSGGDPLMASDSRLDWILGSLRALPHIEILRIGSRIPAALPSRITPELCAMLRKHHPFYMNIHINHPKEITEEVAAACARLADSGIPLGCQTVILKGVNDDPAVMKELMQKLLRIRVKPYYLYMADLVKGTSHFRTKVEAGIRIIEALRGHTSGMAVPSFVIDAPGGGGKIPLLPEYVVAWTEKEIVIRNFENRYFVYPEAQDPFEIPADAFAARANGSKGNGNGKRPGTRRSPAKGAAKSRVRGGDAIG